MYLYQKGDDESMRADTLKFAKENYYNGYSNTRSVQEIFLLAPFIQDSADKHIPSKTKCSVSSVPWISPEIRGKIRRKKCRSCKSKGQRTIGPENAHLKPNLGVLSHHEMTLTLNTQTPLLTS